MHIMQMETHTDLYSFCLGNSYQQWRAQWRPPMAQMFHWVDHEQQIREVTPRLRALTAWATGLPFYFLDSLEIGTGRCVDVGCGTNWFRHFYPSMWGVDPQHDQHRDEELTNAWWIPNWGQWPRVFSVCAMHFCTQREAPQQIAKIRGLLAPGGRAFVALNRARIRDFTQDYQEDQLRDQLAQTPGLTRMVWLDQPGDAPLDGNVWLWLSA